LKLCCIVLLTAAASGADPAGGLDPAKGLVHGRAARAHATPIPLQAYSELRWRLVGPVRAGWSMCAAGIPDQPDTFYFGAADGGVWKTIDAGRTWTSLRHPMQMP